MLSRSLLLCLALFSTSLVSRAELPALPHGATSFGAAVLDGSVYLYGGNMGKAHEFHKDCISGDFLRMPLAGAEKWETLPAGLPLLGAPMVAYHGAIYRVGGMEARNAKGEKDDLHSTDLTMRFRPETGNWETLAPLPQPRSSHDLVVFGDTLYAAGGWLLGAPGNPDKRGGDWHSTLVKLDLTAPAKGWVIEPQPFQRRALAMAVLGDRIWFLGGMDQTDAPSSAVDWLEPKTGKWGKGPDLPDGTMRGFGMAVVATGGQLLASPVTGKLYVLSADGLQWKDAGELKTPRFFHRLLPVDETSVVAVGGSGRTAHVLEPEIVTLHPPAATTASK